MFSNLATKVALKKVGLSSKDLDFFDGSSNNTSKRSNSGNSQGLDDDNGGWAGWMPSLPLTVQPWLSPPPPPVNVARSSPRIGQPAPRDVDRKLRLGGGRRTLIVFLRCVGCAFAQKTFLHLRTISNRYNGAINCVAVSHSSEQATKKWIDLLGGAWNVQVVIDEDRAIYAAWGLGLGSMWYLFNPTTQMQGWKETGWLGEKVAGAIQKKGIQTKTSAASADEDDTSTVMGNKWQEAGAFAVDGRGTVIWGGKAVRADDLMNLDEGAALLCL